MENLTDEELMQLVAKNDKNAFAALVRKYTDYFYRVAYRIVLEKESAEDVVQNSFLKIWKNPSVWKEGKASFKTWFYRIVCNFAISHKRRLKSVELNFEVESNEKTQDKNLQEKQENEILHAALANIPIRQRAAISLVYFEDMKQKEAADAMGINIKAFESLLTRGKDALKKQIG